MKEVTITNDRLEGYFELYPKEWYFCPNCEKSCISRGDNYCSNCGCKVKWELNKKGSYGISSTGFV